LTATTEASRAQPPTGCRGPSYPSPPTCTELNRAGVISLGKFVVGINQTATAIILMSRKLLLSSAGKVAIDVVKGRRQMLKVLMVLEGKSVQRRQAGWVGRHN
jgi:hypothetical protein